MAGALLAAVSVCAHVIGNELKLTFALVIVIGVLLFRPVGLFGQVIVKWV